MKPHMKSYILNLLGIPSARCHYINCSRWGSVTRARYFFSSSDVAILPPHSPSPFTSGWSPMLKLSSSTPPSFVPIPFPYGYLTRLRSSSWPWNLDLCSRLLPTNSQPWSWLSPSRQLLRLPCLPTWQNRPFSPTHPVSSHGQSSCRFTPLGHGAPSHLPQLSPLACNLAVSPSHWNLNYQGLMMISFDTLTFVTLFPHLSICIGTSLSLTLPIVSLSTTPSLRSATVVLCFSLAVSGLPSLPTSTPLPPALKLLFFPFPRPPCCNASMSAFTTFMKSSRGAGPLLPKLNGKPMPKDLVVSPSYMLGAHASCEELKEIFSTAAPLILFSSATSHVRDDILHHPGVPSKFANQTAFTCTDPPFRHFTPDEVATTITETISRHLTDSATWRERIQPNTIDADQHFPLLCTPYYGFMADTILDTSVALLQLSNFLMACCYTSSGAPHTLHNVDDTPPCPHELLSLFSCLPAALPGGKIQVFPGTGVFICDPSALPTLGLPKEMSWLYRSASCPPSPTKLFCTLSSTLSPSSPQVCTPLFQDHTPSHPQRTGIPLGEHVCVHLNASLLPVPFLDRSEGLLAMEPTSHLKTQRSSVLLSLGGVAMHPPLSALSLLPMPSTILKTLRNTMLTLMNNVLPGISAPLTSRDSQLNSPTVS